MRAFRFAGLALAVMPFVPVTEAQADRPVTAVEVVNTGANPVPVVPQGTTAVSGTVSVVNVPTVSVGNTPTVVVGNASPIAVTSILAPPQIEQTIRIVSLGSGTQGGSDSEIVVPAGKVLIFDHVSASANCEPGQTAFLEVNVLNPERTSAGAFRIAPADLGAFPNAPGFPNRQQLIYSQALRVYVKPGASYYFSAIRSATVGTCGFFISYSAHYANSP